MMKNRMFSAILGGSLMVFGAFGCSHDAPGPQGPNAYSGAAGTTSTGVDATGTPAAGPGSTGSSGSGSGGSPNK
jgi:hypothetical protein